MSGAEQPVGWYPEHRPETWPADSGGARERSATRELPAWPMVSGGPRRDEPPSLDDLATPDPPRRRRPWMWVGAAVALVVVVGIVLWQVLPLGGGQTSQGNQNGQGAPGSQTSQSGQGGQPSQGGQPGQTGTGQQPTETPQPATVPQALLTTLPKLPGIPLRSSPMQPVNAVVKDGYYNDAIAAGITRAGAKSILLRESVQANSRIYLLAVIPASTPRICQATAAVINNYQRAIGLTDDQSAAFGANAVTLSRKDKTGTYFRAAYCSDRMTVLVGSAVTDPSQANRLQTGFTDIGRATVRILPPN